MRIERIGDATLYLGDCLEILPTLDKVDAVVTDPPYGIGGSSGTMNLKKQKGNYDANFNDTPEYISNVIVPSFKIALKLSTRAAITPGLKCITFYPQPDDVGCFWMGSSSGWGKWGPVSAGPIFFYGKDPRSGVKQCSSGYSLNEAAEKNGHPCPKPIKSWVWLTNKTSLPNETILDPFMGSGTTGVACANLGRKFIGIEIEEKYFDIACERITAAQAQGRLFD
jgi:site-specific DNA-methyltransferase (adenine-specific)/modification methylase